MIEGSFAGVAVAEITGMIPAWQVGSAAFAGMVTVATAALAKDDGARVESASKRGAVVVPVWAAMV